MANTPSLIKIIVKPGSSKGPLIVLKNSGELTVYLRQRAIDGKANDVLVAALAEYYGVSKTRVTIRRGLTSRHKTISIEIF